MQQTSFSYNINDPEDSESSLSARQPSTSKVSNPMPRISSLREEDESRSSDESESSISSSLCSDDSPEGKRVTAVLQRFKYQIGQQFYSKH